MTTGRTTPSRAGMSGLSVAGVTAVISGVSVFVNSYGVHAVRAPSVYTTAKNLVAFAVLATGALAATAWRTTHPRSAPARWIDPPAHSPANEPALLLDRRVLRWMGLAYVGLVGGGAAFVLFFDGLARTTATPAALDRDTLVIWVALLGVPFLHERVTGWNVAAIALLVGGEITLTLGAGGSGAGAGAGDLEVLAATVLWAVEVIIARRLLADIAPASLALVRMGMGSAFLLAYLATSGALGALASLDAGQTRWVLLTGLLLAGYVGTWMTALSRARAVDVTSILVASALVTGLLQAVSGTQTLAPQLLGLGLIGVGTAMVAWLVPRRAPA